MKLYVIRHGQTDWNLANKTQGKTDIELNSTGIEQARNAKEKIEKLNIDVIISSPLKRAQKTAEIINEKNNCKVIYDKALEERGFGNIEGLSIEEVKKDLKERENYNDYNLNLKGDNVEPVRDLCDRVWGLLDKLKQEYQGKNVLLVTHGGTSRAINAYFNGIGEDGILVSPQMRNCEIKEYQYKD